MQSQLDIEAVRKPLTCITGVFDVVVGHPKSSCFRQNSGAVDDSLRQQRARFLKYARIKSSNSSLKSSSDVKRITVIW